MVLAGTGKPSAFVRELALDGEVDLRIWGRATVARGVVCPKCERPLVQAYALSVRWCPKCQRRQGNDVGREAARLGRAAARFGRA